MELLRHFNLPLIGVELGVAGGSYSEELLQLGVEKLYSIDAWEYMPMAGDISAAQEIHDKNYKTACDLLSKYGDRSIIIKDFSHRAVKQFENNSLGFVYHDASHDIVSVNKDLEIWYPKLVDSGIFALHDYGNEGYGVKSAVIHFTSQKNIPIHLIEETGANNASVWFQKK